MKRIELETYLCEVQKKLKETEVNQKQKQISMRTAFEDMEEKREEWALNDKNMQFMMSKDARSIDLKEFAGVKELRRKTREEYDGAAAKAHTLSVAVEAYNKVIKQCQDEIKRVQGLLAQCGVVVKGPWKAAAK